MPDWFYRTISQPIFFRMSAERSRDLALGVMGNLARLPFGVYAIDVLGHMVPDPQMHFEYGNVRFSSRVGLGSWLDSDGRATRAFTRFGVGLIDLGELRLNPCDIVPHCKRDNQRETLSFTSPTRELKQMRRSLDEAVSINAGIHSAAMIQIASSDADEVMRVAGTKIAVVALTDLDGESHGAERRKNLMNGIRAIHTRDHSKKVLAVLRIHANTDLDAVRNEISHCLEHGLDGVLIDGSIRDSNSVYVGAPVREQVVSLVRQLREYFGASMLIIANGGVHEVEHALTLRAVGADIVLVDSGLVFNGPGLIKRISESFLYRQQRGRELQNTVPVRKSAAFWFAMFGIAMLVGGLMTLIVALTRVILPYDEQFLGMTLRQLTQLAPKIGDFLIHDRITLAGATGAFGSAIYMIARHAMRNGEHWAWLTASISIVVGAFGFFLFLGFGYFDSFHAYVATMLAILGAFGVHGDLPPLRIYHSPPTQKSAVWQRALWGQLLLILHGVALIGAGIFISVVGVTIVFVPEDLHFIETTRAALDAIHANIVPLVAHDRATLGTMLISNGIVFTVCALSGVRAGERWLWWTFLLIGIFGYTPTLFIHASVGYTELLHLVPAFAGAVLLALGLVLTRDYLFDKNSGE
jgi:hypothetical protein